MLVIYFSTPKLRDHTLHPCKATCKIIILCTFSVAELNNNKHFLSLICSLFHFECYITLVVYVSLHLVSNRRIRWLGKGSSRHQVHIHDWAARSWILWIYSAFTVHPSHCLWCTGCSEDFSKWSCQCQVINFPQLGTMVCVLKSQHPVDQHFIIHRVGEMIKKSVCICQIKSIKLLCNIFSKILPCILLYIFHYHFLTNIGFQNVVWL